MSEALTPDVCVIGAGSSGVAVAIEASQAGLRTVLVEKADIGRAPSRLAARAFLTAAHATQRARDAKRFLVFAPDDSRAVDFAAVMAHARAALHAGAPDVSEARLLALGVTIVRGAGRFVAADRLEAGGRAIRARRFVVATGASPVLPHVPGLEQIRFFTPETILDIEDVPERLVVLGAGPAGLEIGQAFRRLGAAVVILDGARALPQFEGEFADIAVAALSREGVDLREHVKALRAEALAAGAFRLHLEGGETIEGTHLLVEPARRPAVDGLGLEAAGVRPSGDGVLVGPDLRTSNRRIFCVGAAAGVASAEAGRPQAGLVLRRSFLGLRRAAPEERVRVVLTDPEIASCGLDETQARKRRRSVRVLRWPLAETGQARAEGLARGHVKIIAAPNGRVLGATIAGPGAGDMIGICRLAAARGLKVEALAELAASGGSVSEALQRAACRGAMPPPSAGGLVRALLGVLRKFG